MQLEHLNQLSSHLESVRSMQIVSPMQRLSTESLHRMEHTASSAVIGSFSQPEDSKFNRLILKKVQDLESRISQNE